MWNYGAFKHILDIKSKQKSIKSAKKVNVSQDFFYSRASFVRKNKLVAFQILISNISFTKSLNCLAVKTMERAWG